MRTPAPPLPTDAQLDEMQRVGDPHADDTIAAILGSCPVASVDELAASAAAATCDASVATRLRRVDKLNEVIRAWRDNADIAAWRPDAALRELGMAGPLERYVTVSRSLPEWAEPDRLRRAERMFMDHGALSVTMLFCASLPECYVVPDLAAVLHATGQLENRADHRLRATGAMIFPVMMTGGLAPASKDGGGIAQILKVRLIHAMVRNLILREPPGAALAASGAGVIPKLARVQRTDSMAATLHVHGWDLEACGVPSNQEELAYTLLTFSYVFLRSMQRLGIGPRDQECEDYLHAWNVAGHFLGIRRELMVDTMDEAAALFDRMQARGRAKWARRPGAEDPRPALGAALMQAMQTVFPTRTTKAFPVLLTRRLIGGACAQDLHLDARVSWWSRFLFASGMGLVRIVDAIARVPFPDFSIARLITRAIGYRLTCEMLMDQTRPLSVPAPQRPGMLALIRTWGHDKKASSRMNAIEDRFTTAGEWEPMERPASR